MEYFLTGLVTLMGLIVALKGTSADDGSVLVGIAIVAASFLIFSILMGVEKNAEKILKKLDEL